MSKITYILLIKLKYPKTFELIISNYKFGFKEISEFSSIHRKLSQTPADPWTEECNNNFLVISQ